MSKQPETLLQMAGLERVVPQAGGSVLVLIDMQNEYLDGKMPLPGVDDAVEATSKLLAFFRKAKTPVIHVAHRGRAGGLFDPQTNSFNFIEAIKPRDSEAVVEKTLPNAFHDTDLEKILGQTGRDQVIFAGLMTHMCVSSSVRCALDLGLNSFVVSDLCASRDLLSPVNGAVIGAREVHSAALAALADRFATILTSQELLPLV